MKNSIKRLVLLAAFILALTSTPLGTFTQSSTISPFVITAEAATQKIHLNKTKKNVYEGNKYTLKLIDKSGKTISASKVKWSSANKKIATVSSRGVVTGKKVGTVKITAIYKGKKYTATITVKPSNVLNKTKATLAAGKKLNLKLTYKGNNVSASSVKWTTSNKSVASVSSKGVVTAKTAGKATITATYKGKKLTCAITVTSTVSANKSSVVFEAGSTSSKAVTITFLESGSVWYDVVEGSDLITCSWSKKWNNNKTTLNIKPNANKSGTAKIKIYSGNNPNRCCYINVTIKSPLSLTVKNKLPCRVSNYERQDFYDKGEALSTVQINKVDYEVLYGDSLKITITFDAYNSCYAEGYYYIKYRVLDEEGFVVTFDRVMTERMFVGDKAREEIYIWDLADGEYTIEFLDHFAS